MTTSSLEERQVGSLARSGPVVTTVAAIGFVADSFPDVALVIRTDELQGLWIRNHAVTGPRGWLRPATRWRTARPLVRRCAVRWSARTWTA